MALIITYQALSHGPVQVQESETVTNSRGETVALPPHAYVVNPGDDLAALPDEVRETCEAWWTPARLAAWDGHNAKLAEAIAAERARQEAIDAAVEAARIEHERLQEAKADASNGSPNG